MLCVLASVFINRNLLWVILLCVPFCDSAISIEWSQSQNKSTAHGVFEENVSDSGEKIQINPPPNGPIVSTTRFPNALHLMPMKPINDRVEQKVTASSPDNDYHSMKRAFDTFNEKMDLYMTFYGNEMSFLTNKLNTMNDKLNTLESLHHEIDQIANRQIMAEQQLHAIQDTIFGSQSINSKLDRLELLMHQMHVRIDDLMEKQRKMAPSNDDLKRMKDIDDTSTNDDGQCEAKVEQLVAFVHSFSELNRLENTDILNRLGNMQSQLIQFFDVNRAIKIGQFNQIMDNVTKDDFPFIENQSQNSSHLGDAQMTNATNEINATDFDMQNTMKIPLIFEDEKKILASNSKSFRKRRRMTNMRNRYKRNHNMNTTQLSNSKFIILNSQNVQHYDQEPKNQNIDIDIDFEIIKSDNQTSAKYGQPSQYGCHQFINVDRADEIHRFPSANGLNSDRLCSFDRNGTAWTVIQLRGLQNNMSAPENFNRSWFDYKYGFGNLSGEFWYGNDFIHKLTYDDDMELKIQLETWDGRHIEFEYDTFRVDSEENRYNLFISGYRGSDKKLDALKYHHNQDFSTFDRQNDKTGVNDTVHCCSCAKSYASGWWFNNCIEANLNGVYQLSPWNNNYVGIIWEKWLGDYSLKGTKMMIRPKINWSNRNQSEDYDDDTSKRPPDDP